MPFYSNFHAFKSRLSVVACSIALILPSSAISNDGKTVVDFAQNFENLLDGIRVVAAHPLDEKIVITSGTYTLSKNGGPSNGLEITGGVVELSGDVIIRAFDPNFVPTEKSSVAGTGATGGVIPGHGGNGRNGGAGATGETGTHGLTPKRISIRFYELTGEGTLTIISNGSNGGRGGVGGKGGNGGKGADGRNRCGAHGWDGCKGSCSCTNGGTGGNGGPGGVGGKGGNAGNGGTIVINSDLQKYIDSGKIVLVSSPGSKGGGGPGGAGGTGGGYGHYGRGSECGGGCRHGGTGGAGTRGGTGAPGQDGSDGQVIISN